MIKSAVDKPHEVTVFYAQHVIGSPVSGSNREIIKYVLEDLGCAGR